VNRRHPVFQILFGAAVAVLTCGMPQSAHAHRLSLFATAEGTRISGYAYFPGGGRAKNLTVEVLAPDGTRLTRVKTDEQGEFAFTATMQSDHRLRAETGDGHRAEWLVRAEELAAALPPYGSPTPTHPAPANPHLPAEGDQLHPRLATRPPEGDAPAGIATELRTLQAQLTALRCQIEASANRTRLQDVLGGLGYIAGLAGLASFLLRKRTLQR
jgi:nickel transport protein